MHLLHSDTIALYSKIDTTIDAHFMRRNKQAPCAKGCASCCSQFFEISTLEYSIIHEHLTSLPPDQQALLKKNALTTYELFKEHWPNFCDNFFSEATWEQHTDAYYQHTDRFNVVLPCIFLSSEGTCNIYDYRPIVCRTTGVSFQNLYTPGAVCNVIRHGLFTPLWQADLRELKDEIDQVRWLPDDSNDIGVKRQYPMFYYVYKLL